MVKTARKGRSKEKAITYKELRQMLEAEGFVFRIVKSKITINGEHSLFEHKESGAELRYPIFRPSDPVRPVHLMMARVTMDGFGVMAKEDFDRWTRDPKRFQAA